MFNAHRVESPGAGKFRISANFGFLSHVDVLELRRFQVHRPRVEGCRNPKHTLPIAFVGGVLVVIVLYILIAIVAVGHLSFSEVAGIPATRSQLCILLGMIVGSIAIELIYRMIAGHGTYE